MGDFDRTIFYDRVNTMKEIDAAKEEAKKVEIEEE